MVICKSYIGHIVLHGPQNQLFSSTAANLRLGPEFPLLNDVVIRPNILWPVTRQFQSHLWLLEQHHCYIRTWCFSCHIHLCFNYLHPLSSLHLCPLECPAICCIPLPHTLSVPCRYCPQLLDSCSSSCWDRIQVSGQRNMHSGIYWMSAENIHSESRGWPTIICQRKPS